MSSDNLPSIMNDIRAYVRISAAASSKAAAKGVIDTWEKATVYSRIDGKKSVQSIAESVGVPRTTINDWLKDFIQSGLASEPNEFQSSHRALFTLRELGIDITQLKKKGSRSPTPNQAESSSSPPSPTSSMGQSTIDSGESGGEKSE